MSEDFNFVEKEPFRLHGEESVKADCCSGHKVPCSSFGLSLRRSNGRFAVSSEVNIAARRAGGHSHCMHDSF